MQTSSTDGQSKENGSCTQDSPIQYVIDISITADLSYMLVWFPKQCGFPSTAMFKSRSSGWRWRQQVPPKCRYPTV